MKLAVVPLLFALLHVSGESFLLMEQGNIEDAFTWFTAGHKVLVIGDWGQRTDSSSRPGQERVATAMDNYLEENPCRDTIHCVNGR
jgi:hypothetical protein